MQRKTRGAFAFFGLLCLAAVPACADEDASSFHERTNYVVVGVIQSLNAPDDRMVVNGNDDHRYVVDAYGADITLLDKGLGETADLARGMRIRVVGSLLGHNLLEADRVRVLPSFAGAGSAPAPVYVDRPVYIDRPVYVDRPVAVDSTPAPAPPALPLPPEPAPAPAQPQLNVDGLIRAVDTPHAQITMLGDDDKRYTVDVAHTDIILPGTERAGQIADLAPGLRVRLIGANAAERRRGSGPPARPARRFLSCAASRS